MIENKIQIRLKNNSLWTDYTVSLFELGNDACLNYIQYKLLMILNEYLIILNSNRILNFQEIVKIPQTYYFLQCGISMSLIGYLLLV